MKPITLLFFTLGILGLIINVGGKKTVKGINLEK